MEKVSKNLVLYAHGTEVYLIVKNGDGVHSVLSPTPTKPLFISDARWTRSEDSIEYMINGSWHKDVMIKPNRQLADDFAKQMNSIKGVRA